MKKPGYVEAMEHMCHECIGHYIDGKVDCGCVKCPIYSWMPYREQEPDLDRFRFRARCVGFVEKTPPKPAQIARGRALAASQKNGEKKERE